MSLLPPNGEKVTNLNLEHVTRNCANSPSKCFDMTSEDRKRVAPELRKWRGWGVCRCVVLRSPAPTCDCSIYAARNHARQLQVKLLTRLTSSPLSAPNMYTWGTPGPTKLPTNSSSICKQPQNLNFLDGLIGVCRKAG